MKNDLTALSVYNVMRKYADDIFLLVPEHTDIDLSSEFNHVKQWAEVNNMVLNLIKNKEIVFERPCPKRHYLPPLTVLHEQVDAMKELGYNISATVEL